MEEWEYILRLVAAIIAGAIIGVERELHDKPAGFRTNILICFGAALFTVMSITMVGEAYSDRARIAAQVVTGVGFLGAGTVLRRGETIKGLTTAAALWTVTAIGVAIGFGMYTLALLGAASMLLILRGLGYIQGHRPEDGSSSDEKT